MPNPDGLFMVPVLPTPISAIAGAFMQVSTEDLLMQMVWRVRTWEAIAETSVSCHFTPPDLPFVPILSGQGVEIQAGANPLSMVPPYSSEEDILCNFRSSTGEATYTSLGIPQTTQVTFGPTIEYSEKRTIDGVPIEGSGTFESVISIMATDGDVFCELTNVEKLGYLGTSLYIDFEIGGVVLYSTALYTEDISATFPDFFWSGSNITMRPASWWAWPLDGEPTWDSSTGAQLLSPDRVGDNGRTLAFLAGN